MANHERPIEFINGLLDPSTLLEFMDNCHCAQLRPGLPVDHKLEYHHLYFPEPAYEGISHPLALRKLRNSPYNLVEMFSCQEDTYHQTVSTDVLHDDVDLDAAKTFAQEASWLTDFAASSWMLAGARDRRELNDSGTRIKRAFQDAMIDHLESKVVENGEHIRHISVMHQVVVLGALNRYIKQQPEPTARAILDSLELGEIALPVKIYRTGALESLARTKLKRKQKTISWILKKTLPDQIIMPTPALQTGVNAV